LQIFSWKASMRRLSRRLIDYGCLKRNDGEMYAILYTIEPEFVLIVSVGHCSREPGYWKERLGKAIPAKAQGADAP
ncbi:MAG: hypothetical protein ABJC05_08805, partial [Pyrinomonadaceae bacterium]